RLFLRQAPQLVKRTPTQSKTAEISYDLGGQNLNLGSGLELKVKTGADNFARSIKVVANERRRTRWNTTDELILRPVLIAEIIMQILSSDRPVIGNCVLDAATSGPTGIGLAEIHRIGNA